MEARLVGHALPHLVDTGAARVVPHAQHHGIHPGRGARQGAEPALGVGRLGAAVPSSARATNTLHSLTCGARGPCCCPPLLPAAAPASARTRHLPSRYAFLVAVQRDTVLQDTL